MNRSVLRPQSGFHWEACRTVSCISNFNGEGLPRYMKGQQERRKLDASSSVRTIPLLSSSSMSGLSGILRP